MNIFKVNGYERGGGASFSPFCEITAGEKGEGVPALVVATRKRKPPEILHSHASLVRSLLFISFKGRGEISAVGANEDPRD